MKKYIFLLTLFFLPVVSFAALDGVKGLISEIKGLINPLLGIISSLALVYFMWGVAQFILKDSGSDKTRADGQKKIMWGIVALFVIFSLWGILNFIGRVTGLGAVQGQTSSGDSGFLFPEQGGWKLPTFGSNSSN